jgi:hypothetical protein
VHRGERRAFVSIVIDVDERAHDHTMRFGAFDGRPVATLAADAVRALLLESGLWTALRARPYGRVADPGTSPRSSDLRTSMRSCARTCTTRITPPTYEAARPVSTHRSARGRLIFVKPAGAHCP